jgi:cell division septation protein DedD
VRRALPYLAALLLGAAAAVAVGCGDRSNLVPAGAAQDLEGNLAAARTAIAQGRCAAAGQAVQAARQTALDLPSGIDRRLRIRINDGIRQLQRTYLQACAAAQTTTDTTTTETQTQTTETTPTETTPTTPTATATTPTETTPTTPTGTTTEPSTATPAETTTPGDDTGGTPGDQGAPAP